MGAVRFRQVTTSTSAVQTSRKHSGHTHPDIEMPSLEDYKIQRSEHSLVVHARIRLQQRLDAIAVTPNSDCRQAGRLGGPHAGAHIVGRAIIKVVIRIVQQRCEAVPT